jgi:hypothetical protein
MQGSELMAYTYHRLDAMQNHVFRGPRNSRIPTRNQYFLGGRRADLREAFGRRIGGAGEAEAPQGKN